MTTLAPREVGQSDSGTGHQRDDHPYLRLVPSPSHSSETPDSGTAIEDFYPEGFEDVGELGAGLRVLSETIEHLEEAREASLEERIFDSDDLAIRASRAALDGFRYATIGEGWSTILVAVHAAIRNRGEQLTVPQLEQLAIVCRVLRNEPNLGRSRALDAIETLEQVDLDPMPEALAILGELGDESP